MLMQVEFNKAALSLSEAIPQEQKNTALNRLLKACAAPSLLWQSYSQDACEVMPE